jgi:hypothetical protein
MVGQSPTRVLWKLIHTATLRLSHPLVKGTATNTLTGQQETEWDFSKIKIALASNRVFLPSLDRQDFLMVMSQPRFALPDALVCG